MPLLRAEPREPNRHYTALVAVPAFNAASTIETTLASIERSVALYEERRGAGEIAISVVDDASDDETPDLVADFATRSALDVFLTVHERNRGRAVARNRALALADSDCCLFLDLFYILCLHRFQSVYASFCSSCNRGCTTSATNC